MYIRFLYLTLNSFRIYPPWTFALARHTSFSIPSSIPYIMSSHSLISPSCFLHTKHKYGAHREAPATVENPRLQLRRRCLHNQQHLAHQKHPILRLHDAGLQRSQPPGRPRLLLSHPTPTFGPQAPLRSRRTQGLGEPAAVDREADHGQRLVGDGGERGCGHLAGRRGGARGYRSDYLEVYTVKTGLVCLGGQTPQNVCLYVLLV